MNKKTPSPDLIEGFCNPCQKRSYPNRRRARRARKMTRQSDGLNVYACPEGTGLFHVGHLAPGVRTGDIDRRQL